MPLQVGRSLCGRAGLVLRAKVQGGSREGNCAQTGIAAASYIANASRAISGPLFERADSHAMEITMKKLISITAILLSLAGSVNFAMAQSYPDMGANTGTEANRQAHSNDGEYTASP
jgi:hypothetical protein